MMGQDEDTPLHLAAEKGHAEIASVLIDNRADINSKGNVSILLYICNFIYICNYMIYHQY